MFVFSSKQHDTRYFLKLEYYNVNCLHLAICSDINILVNNLEYLACYCLCPLSQILRACLHGGGGPQTGEVTCGGSPHLSCKQNQVKMRDYMDRRVTPPTWGPPPPCKQALHVSQC